jgi:hypothetical protein
MSVNAQPPTPEHGAALRILYERFNLRFIVSREQHDSVCAALKEIEAWAVTQPQNVKHAYLWATNSFRQESLTRVQIYENKERVEKAYETLPQPPTQRELEGR